MKVRWRLCNLIVALLWIVSLFYIDDVMIGLKMEKRILLSYQVSVSVSIAIITRLYIETRKQQSRVLHTTSNPTVKLHRSQ